MPSYQVAPLFLIRAAGVPFDLCQRIGTPETAGLARRLLADRQVLATAKNRAERLLGLRERVVRRGVTRLPRAKALAPIAYSPPHPEEMEAHARAAAALHDTEAEFDTTLRRELDEGRRWLLRTSAAVLPAYLVFGAGSFGERVSELVEAARATDGELPPRNARHASASGICSSTCNACRRRTTPSASLVRPAGGKSMTH